MGRIEEKMAGILGKEAVTREDCKWAIDIGEPDYRECRRMPPHGSAYPLIRCAAPVCGEYAIRPWRKGLPADVLAKMAGRNEENESIKETGK